MMSKKIHWLQQMGLFPRLNESPGIELMQTMATTTMEAWNKAFPVGSHVKVYRTYGDEKTTFHSITRSPAYVIHGHSAMVMVHVDGKVKEFPLTNVEPLAGRATVEAQSNLLALKSCIVMVLQDQVGTHGEGVAA